MCRRIYRYECGHAREKKMECRRGGKVSLFLSRVLYGKVCNEKREKRRDKLCRACDSQGDEYYDDGHRRHREHERSDRARREHRGDRHRERERSRHRHRDHDRDHRDHRRHHHRQQHRGHHREQRGSRQDPDRNHTRRSTRQGQSSPEPHHDLPREPEVDANWDYAAWRHHWEASSQADNIKNWVHNVGAENPSDSCPASERIENWVNSVEAETHASAARPASHRHSAAHRSVAQENPEANIAVANPPTPDDNVGPASVQAVQQGWEFPETGSASKSNSPSPREVSPAYVPARAAWAQLPSLPANTYCQDAPPRPPSSFYASEAGPPPPPASEAVATRPDDASEYITIYVDSEVDGAVEAEARDSTWWKESFQGPEIGTMSSTHGNGPQNTGQRPPAPPGTSRYAGLAANPSEFEMQQEKRPVSEKREKTRQAAEDRANAELRREQEKARRPSEKSGKAKRKTEAQEEAEQRRKEGSRDSHHHRHSRRSDRSSHQVRDPVRRVVTNEYSDRPRREQHEDLSIRPYSAPQGPSPKSWDPVLQEWRPEPTPSTVDSQVFEHPRSAPCPPMRAAQATHGRQRQEDEQTTVSLFYPRPVDQNGRKIHSVDPRILEENWGSTGGRSRGKRSTQTSGRSSGTRSSKGSKLGKSLLEKLHLRKQASEASFKCVDVSRHDEQFRPRSPSRGRRRS
ncbi:hypothetical protein ACRE_046970 [Hapsidospora chrysogenum ATCC 11550]|uniref:Uncharacterized protein n=1 Tax=Hapsidospora chrysogenum (strain ATCC 11550 / CBS 779.69 / DSM 880 / IAM 14645 / JCM 23072 / IMI 49137) TaxID=857340 RepID=A0A086T590_HAPC1|nr:hypothetical protein ACRE_046970 [Hapsidospora chrysogenum ATCC 11550]